MDSLDALNDQIEPASSNDMTIPRFTWWDHKGTTEWVQYDFKSPATVSAAEVYFFDDTGIGGCRIPKSWRILYQDGSDWKPVEITGQYTTNLNAYNRIPCKPVNTPALRLEVQLQPGFSGGILEWRVLP